MINPGSEQRSLWRDSSFVLLWAGSAVDIAGTQIRLVVLPILVFQLTGSAAQTSVLLTLVLLPYLVFGLVAGAVADHANRRLLMISCDLVAAVAVGGVLVATVGSATALWIDGASYALAALTLALIPRPFGRADHVVGSRGLRACSRTSVRACGTCAGTA